jgi:hypothetical protein
MATKLFLVSGNISKLDVAKRQVFGFASVTTVKSTEVVDLQGDTISDEECENAAYEFVLNSRIAGEMHKKLGVGNLIESIFFSKEKQRALGIDLGKVGWWVGFQVTDDAVWEKVVSGLYKAFSIAGTASWEDVEDAALAMPLTEAA